MRVAMEHRQATVLGGRRRNQRVGERHAVLAVVACSKLGERAHRGVSDRAIVADDP
jgi:hypothetical protein